MPWFSRIKSFSMDELPNELLIQIIGELQDNPDGQQPNVLTPLALVNRRWKGIVEPFVWREVLLSFNEVERFRQYFTDSNRRKSLRVLRIQLNDYFQYSNDEDEASDEENEEDEENEADEDSDPSDDGIEGIDMDESDQKCDDDSDEETTTSSQMLEATIDEALNEHRRVFSEIQIVWDELYNWGTALRVDTLHINIHGQSFYKFLGPEWREDWRVDWDLLDNLRRYTKPPTTNLPSVTALTVKASQDLQIWPAIVGCTIAGSLTNLEDLRIFDSDWDKKWCYLRSELRDVLAYHITNLSRKTLRTFELSLPFKYSMNHDVNPPNLLRNGIDTLSNSLNALLTNLVTLSININHLSPALFWNPDVKAPEVLYPNLRSLHVDTGFETASGKYIMRRPISMLFSRDGHFENIDEYPVYTDPDSNFTDWEVDRDYDVADYPTAFVRVRPKHAYFNELAVSLAHAATHMPRLESITIEFVSHFTDRGKWTGYHGWGFAFRAGPEARYPETHTHTWCGNPGLDMWDNATGIPYREWTFRCELDQLKWDEPNEVKLLWEQRFPGIKSDIVCFDFDEKGKDCWIGYYTDLAIHPEEMMDRKNARDVG